MMKIGRFELWPGFFRDPESLPEMKLLSHIDTIDDPLRLPGAETIFDTGKIRSEIETSSIFLGQDT